MTGHRKSQRKKTSSRELGLILTQQLLDVEDLHYGLWDADLPLTAANLATAQQRYTDLLLERITNLVSGIRAPTILDVGCGTGHMLQLMLERGWRADAVNPSPTLNAMVRERLRAIHDHPAQLLETTFESIPPELRSRQYDLILFSESFQYLDLAGFFAQAASLLRDGGALLICDFFRTAADGDGAPGDGSFGGGHKLDDFYRALDTVPFAIELDEDLTSRVSPNIALIDHWLQSRLAPAAATLDQWLLAQYPLVMRLLKWLLRRKLARLGYKYLSGHRNQPVFERYKSYRLIVLRHVMT
jgi:SAM-dependent methyltransferase